MKNQLDSCVEMIEETFSIEEKNISSTRLKAIVMFPDFERGLPEMALIGRKSILEITRV